MPKINSKLRIVSNIRVFAGVEGRKTAAIAALSCRSRRCSDFLFPLCLQLTQKSRAARPAQFCHVSATFWVRVGTNVQSKGHIAQLARTIQVSPARNKSKLGQVSDSRPSVSRPQNPGLPGIGCTCRARQKLCAIRPRVGAPTARCPAPSNCRRWAAAAMLNATPPVSPTRCRPQLKSMTWRIALPSCRRSNPSLISSSRILCVMSRSTGIRPCAKSARNLGMSRLGTPDPR